MTLSGLALVKNPRVLFMDEPTTGLDSFTANEARPPLPIPPCPILSAPPRTHIICLVPASATKCDQVRPSATKCD